LRPGAHSLSIVQAPASIVPEASAPASGAVAVVQYAITHAPPWHSHWAQPSDPFEHTSHIFGRAPRQSVACWQPPASTGLPLLEPELLPLVPPPPELLLAELPPPEVLPELPPVPELPPPEPVPELPAPLAPPPVDPPVASSFALASKSGPGLAAPPQAGGARTRPRRAIGVHRRKVDLIVRLMGAIHHHETGRLRAPPPRARHSRCSMSRKVELWGHTSVRVMNPTHRHR
jgi:hypothetical protein